MKVWLVLLSFNVIAIGGFMFQRGCDPMLWLNLLGCVVLGMAIEQSRAAK